MKGTARKDVSVFQYIPSSKSLLQPPYGKQMPAQSRSPHSVFLEIWSNTIQELKGNGTGL